MIPAALLSAASATMISVIAVGIVRAYTLRRAVLDQPNERSSHTVPTPRGGGLGLLVAFGIVGIGMAAPISWPLTLALGGVLATMTVGWRDDRGGVSVRNRLIVHVLTGISLAPMAWMTHGAAPAGLRTALVLWWIFYVVSSINVVNFIDGIDGLVGAQMVVFATHCVLLLTPEGDGVVLASALGGASLGFLAWNWSPARIFLGDVGSGALGALTVVIALVVAEEVGRAPWLVLLPLYPIFLDATVTLLSRARRGARLSEAHREHLYQRLANGGWGHAKTGATYAVFAGAAIPLARNSEGVALYIAIVGALMWSLWRLASDLPDSRLG